MILGWNVGGADRRVLVVRWRKRTYQRLARLAAILGFRKRSFMLLEFMPGKLSNRRHLAVACAIALLCTCLPVYVSAQSTPQALSTNAVVSPELASLELWVKIIGGALAGLIALVGVPAAFLQFSKTRAELVKLRLEAKKLTAEVGGNQRAIFQPDAIHVSLQESPGAVVQIETISGLSGPILVVIDFVISYIVYNIFHILLSLSPLGGYLGNLIETIISAIVFSILFFPVFSNGRQARLLLREVSEARRLTEQKREQAIVTDSIHN